MDIGNLTDAYIGNVARQNDTAAQLKNNIDKADFTRATEDELLGACKEFEAYFLEQVFKGMQKTVDCFKDEENTSNYTNGMLDYFKDETIRQLADTSTKTQGLGLAQSLYEQMKRNYDLQ